MDLLLEAVRSGLSGALVVRGEAGVGKTALLDATVAAAGDLRVLRLVGIESEMELGYAGLHQLVHPFEDELEALPTRRARRARVAFGLEEAASVDRLLVSLGTLTLLSTVASRQPLLCVVDDAQWLDRESTDVLAFVARRLFADGVGLVIAVRDPDGEHLLYRGVSELRLAGLAEPDAAQLLASVAAGPVQPDVARQIAVATGGTPWRRSRSARGSRRCNSRGGRRCRTSSRSVGRSRSSSSPRCERCRTTRRRCCSPRRRTRPATPRWCCEPVGRWASTARQRRRPRMPT